FNSATSSLTTPADIPAGVWTHVVATFDGFTMRLYLNGTEVASRTFTGAITHSNATFRIGNGQTTNATQFPFKGLIDEVAVYNQARTPPQLSAAPTSWTLPKTAGSASINGAPHADVHLQGGTLGGPGVITGDVTNTAGVVAPGNSPGTLDIIGNYVQA